MGAQPRLEADDGGVIELSEEEGRALFEERARALFGISGDEFRKRWHAGEFDANEEDPRVWQVAFLLGGEFSRR